MDVNTQCIFTLSAVSITKDSPGLQSPATEIVSAPSFAEAVKPVFVVESTVNPVSGVKLSPVPTICVRLNI